VRYSFLVVTVAIVLRSIPEILAGRYPVGFDVTAAYPFIIATFPSESLVTMLGQAPLFYALIWSVHSVSGIDIYTILKVTGPVLYGALAASFFVFLSSFLKFSMFKSLVGTLLFVFQPITLRISWDLFHNELGLILMIATLAVLGTIRSHKRLIGSVLSVLTVLVHLIAALLLFAVIVGQTSVRGLSRDSLRQLTPVVPAVGLFLVALLAFYMPVQGSRVIFLAPNPNASSPSILQNVYHDDFRFIGASYWLIPAYVGMLFVVSFAPLLPLAAKGVSREPSMNWMTGLLALGSFSVIVSPSASIPWYYRWEMLLIIPLTVFSLHGLEKMRLFVRSNYRFLTGLLLGFLVIGAGYSSGLLSYMGVYGVNSYAPATMVQSSIPPSHIDDTVTSLKWLNSNSPRNSYLLTDERFLSFGYLTLRDDFRFAIQPGGMPFRGAVDRIVASNPSALYLVWDSQVALPGFSLSHAGSNTWIYQYDGKL